VTRSEGIRLLTIVSITAVIWIAMPTPTGLTDQAWELALIFAATIVSVLSNALPIFVASITALAVAVLGGAMSPKQAYSGFSADVILLIVAAFLVARAVVKSGLGHRIAWFIIARFGQSTLGLAYSLMVADLCIAPAFPSNTARAGVLYPIAESLALSLDSRPEPSSRRRVGSYLMMSGIAGLSISSALWLTAMAANAVGVAIAREQGINITFTSWLIAASVPCLIAAAIMPWVVYRVFPPQLHKTPDAPANARKQLAHMGPISRKEGITAFTFCAIVILWALSDVIGANNTAVAFAGLAFLMLCSVYDVADIKAEGGTLEVFIWFAILFAMSTTLNELGFMRWMGDHISAAVAGLQWPWVFVLLLVAYIVIHYFFVSQTAHMLALFPVFLSVGVSSGVPGHLMAFSILFATNYFSAQTPQASSSNVIFAGTGYLEMKDIYRVGFVVTLVNTLIFGSIGSLWICLVT
jgi:DASS family divalent anion:Na+ symporter